MRLPSRSYLAHLPPDKATAILSALERELVKLLKNQASLTFDHRGSAYDCRRFRQKLKRIEAIRKDLDL
jgi:hypothetical protein